MTNRASEGQAGEEFVALLTFHVGGEEEQRTFLAAYRPVVEAFVSDQPGFVGATLYASTDGTRIVNLTRWKDQAAYRDFLERSDPAPRMRAIEAAFASVPGMTGPDMQLTHTFRPTLDIAPSAPAAAGR